ncbi:MAG: histidine phosphatase family protein [Sellimonas intestinalis]|uniref:histidine phosphatase family protein n=1 Tax=Sellimonas intestinalis TaxID=1653434 RepID=UPI0039A28309
MEILMFRHFATAGNLEKRYIGTTDEPILPVSSVSGVPEVEIVLASPLLRCRETAGLLYPRLDPVLIEDSGSVISEPLRERITGN